MPIRRASHWTQFSTDLQVARDWVDFQLDNEGLSLPLGHQALNLGMVEKIRELLRSSDVSQQEKFVGLRFRIARLDEDENPYEYLLRNDMKEDFNQLIEGILNGKEVFKISIDGGLGDVIEAISILTPLVIKYRNRLKIYTKEHYKYLLSPLLNKGLPIEFARERGQGIRYLLFRSWMSSNCKDMKPLKWIARDFSTKINQNKYIFCWRASGVEASFSAFLRSLGFKDIQDFYCELRKSLPNVDIIDISSWNLWERRILINQGIRIYVPEQGTIENLLSLIDGRRVITIDTALAHLCAASGYHADVCLPLFSDERWLELRRSNTNYSKYLTFFQQSEFCSWTDTLESILDTIK